MKLFKLSVPVGLVALVAIAVFVPSAAMAESTVLCEADEDPCSLGNQVTNLHLEADDLIVLTDITDYECDALIQAQALALDSPQVLHAYITYGSCGQGCTRQEASDGFLIEVLRIGSELAEFVFKGLEAHAVCGLILNCTFDLEGMAGVVVGPLSAGENGQVRFDEAPLIGEGFGQCCPTEAALDAMFEPSVPLYVKS